MSEDFEVIFITSDKCPHCRRLKEAWKPLFDYGIVKNLSVDTDEGLELAKKLNLRYVPACIVKEKDNFRFCEGDELANEI